MTTFWITKYALTGGIFSIESTVGDHGLIKDTRATFWSYFRLDHDAFATREAAVADAERRRIKKIAGLRKQIAKLEKLSFIA